MSRFAGSLVPLAVLHDPQRKGELPRLTLPAGAVAAEPTTESVPSALLPRVERTPIRQRPEHVEEAIDAAHEAALERRALVTPPAPEVPVPATRRARPVRARAPRPRVFVVADLPVVELLALRAAVDARLDELARLGEQARELADSIPNPRPQRRKE